MADLAIKTILEEKYKLNMSEFLKYLETNNSDLHNNFTN
jgi:hypothetical protein